MEQEKNQSGSGTCSRGLDLLNKLKSQEIDVKPAEKKIKPVDEFVCSILQAQFGLLHGSFH